MIGISCPKDGWTKRLGIKRLSKSGWNVVQKDCRVVQSGQFEKLEMCWSDRLSQKGRSEEIIQSGWREDVVQCR